MLQYKALYKAMYDDLKDADMLIDYAKELKEENLAIAKELAAYASERMTHFDKFHNLFVTLVKKSKEEDKKDSSKVQDCLWDITHEHFQEWSKNIKERIGAF